MNQSAKINLIGCDTIVNSPSCISNETMNWTLCLIWDYGNILFPDFQIITNRNTDRNNNDKMV